MTHKDSPCPVCKNTGEKKESPYKGTSALFNAIQNKVLTCLECGHAYIEPMPTQEQLDEFYKTYWVDDNAVQSSDNASLNLYKVQCKSRVDYLRKRIPEDKKITLLDFGAGHGLFGDALKEAGMNIDYYVCEADEKVVEGLIEKGVTAATKIELLPIQQFDVVVCFHVLEHLPDSRGFIQLLLNAVGKEGLLFLELPNQDHLWKDNFQPHIYFFNEKSLSILLKETSSGSYNIESCGRKLSDYIKEKGRSKLARKFNAALKKSGIKKQAGKDETSLRQYYEMDSYGNDRQWLRAIIKK